MISAMESRGLPRLSGRYSSESDINLLSKDSKLVFYLLCNRIFFSNEIKSLENIRKRKFIAKFNGFFFKYQIQRRAKSESGFSNGGADDY